MAIDRAKITKQAENYMAQGRLDRAIEEYLKLIEDKSDDYNLMNRVGDAYLQAGHTSEALEMFKRAGQGFERGGFNAKASAVFKKAHRAVPEDLDICVRLAELYRQTSMVKDAIQIHIEVAEAYTKKGLLKRALEEFAKVVDLDPKNLKNKVKLADLYNKEGMKEEAAAIYLDVAESLAMEQMHMEAGQILERAKAMVSTPQVFLTQSRLAVIQKDLPGAAAHLREGLASNPRSAELLDALAEVELQAKAPDRALEALGEVPQLPEKSLLLAERALRDMVKGGYVDAALKLFKPIGRDFARRGHGDAAARTLRQAFQGHLNAEAWVQLADIAHQSGNRAEQVEHLRRAYAMAKDDDTLFRDLQAQLRGLGVQDLDQAPTPLAAVAPSAPSGMAAEPVEENATRRIQIEQLEREAEAAVRNRFNDRALEVFARILELEPTHTGAINRIADIHRATGILSKVQMHFVRHAEKLAALGHKQMAVDLLDQAEGIFPGSTRLYRRNLGLLDFVPGAKGAAAIPLPPPPPQELEPIEETLSDGTLSSLEELPLIPLDLEPAPGARIPPPVPEPAHALESQELPPLPEPFLEGLELPGWEVPAPQATDSQSYPALPEYEWTELEAPIQEPPTEELPPLDLEPLPFATGPDAQAPAAEVDGELASTLADVDFQLDYGSPEEAKIEIDSALQSWPRHPELLARLEQAEAALARRGVKPPAAEGTPGDGDFEHAFFDLSDVLGDALLESGEGEEMHDATNVVEKIQSVDELFNAFREGVEQQVKGDDYDTHYNLGIAYKEMLLLEPAIEEFKKAMHDPERTLECCSMLAICEHAQDHAGAAMDWLRQGIQAPGFPPEDALGLHYDLGLLLQEQGRADEAQGEFRIVADLDPEYRDVARMLQ